MLDSSVLRYSPDAIYAFGDNLVVIPNSVVKELERLSLSGHGEELENARAFGLLVDELVKTGSLSAGVDLPTGGRLIIYGKEDETVLQTAAAMNCNKQYSGSSLIVVSQNPYFRIMANALGLQTESFKYNTAPATEGGYDGRCCLYVSDKAMRTFSDDGALQLEAGAYYATRYDGSHLSDDYQPAVNEYVVLYSAANPAGLPMLGQFNGEAVVALRNYSENGHMNLLDVKPKNIGQVFAIDALLAPAEEIPLVILKGPACTGKTFLSIAMALAQTQNTFWGGIRDYRKILLTRPSIQVEDDAFRILQGDDRNDVPSVSYGFAANLENLINQINTKYHNRSGMNKLTMRALMLRDVIAFRPMIYTMTQPITNQFIIADTAQNATVKQILSLISRADESSKIVIVGNPYQTTHPYLDKWSNGLAYVSEHMCGSKLCCQMTFSETECIRSPIAKEAVQRLMPKDVAV